MNMIKNPVLPGFYPDPSVCRAGDDYYIACSSFSFFPGIPVFHSRDLANWEQIGYAFDDPELLRLSSAELSAGLFAPTMRYYNGVFYIIVKNMTAGQLLLAKTADPTGKWEGAVVKGDAADPSLFWDDDGVCWCSYTAVSDGRLGIYNSRLDIDNCRMEKERFFLWSGAAADAPSPEAAHIYKKDGCYYLTISEGGTEHYHAVCVARSRKINGPYESFPGNPILTHRHLAPNYPVCNVGHGDLFSAPSGQWFMACLASRLAEGYRKYTGRETYICPVVWEGGWPLASPGTGRLEESYPSPLPEAKTEGCVRNADFEDNFTRGIGLQWNYIGSPTGSEVKTENGKLRIKALPFPKIDAAAKKTASPGFLGCRRRHISFEAETVVSFMPGKKSSAGMILLQNGYNHIRVELAQREGAPVVQAVRYADITPSPLIGTLLPVIDVKEEHTEQVLGSMPAPSGRVSLKMKVCGGKVDIYAGEPGRDYVLLAGGVDGTHLGSETCGGFIGGYVGLFARSDKAETECCAEFECFKYHGKD